MQLLVTVVLCLFVPASSAAAVKSDQSAADCSTAHTSFGSAGGVIFYPGSEEQYNRTNQCEWIISHIESTARVAILFGYLSLKKCPDCSCENIEIYNDKGVLLNRFCGDDWTQPVIDLTPSTPLRVKFNSKITDHKKGGGFQLLYSFQEQVRNTSYPGMPCGLSFANMDSTAMPSTAFTDPGMWPWVVYIQVRVKDQIRGCGGTLLNDQWVITSAQCLTSLGSQPQVVLRLNTFDLIMKGNDEIWTTADKIVVHPDYNSTSLYNNLALIRLSESVPYNPVCLLASDETLPYPWSELMSVGWGEKNDLPFYVSSKRQLALSHRFDPACIVNHADLDEGRRKVSYCSCPMFINGQSCHGEDGGPLLQYFLNRYYLLGVGSWSSGGCTVPDKIFYRSNIYNKVVPSNTWIISNILP